MTPIQFKEFLDKTKYLALARTKSPEDDMSVILIQLEDESILVEFEDENDWTRNSDCVLLGAEDYALTLPVIKRKWNEIEKERRLVEEAERAESKKWAERDEAEDARKLEEEERKQYAILHAKYGVK